MGLADAVWETAARPEGYRLAGIALDPVAAPRKMTKLWGEEAGQATKVDRILVLATSEGGRRARSPGRARRSAGTGRAREAPLHSGHEVDVPPRRPRRDGSARPDEEPRPRPDESRRLSYVLQQQVHLYTPEANRLREEIDTYVEAERQIEGEMSRRAIRA